MHAHTHTYVLFAITHRFNRYLVMPTVGSCAGQSKGFAFGSTRTCCHTGDSATTDGTPCSALGGVACVSTTCVSGARGGRTDVAGGVTQLLAAAPSPSPLASSPCSGLASSPVHALAADEEAPQSSPASLEVLGLESPCGCSCCDKLSEKSAAATSPVPLAFPMPSTEASAPAPAPAPSPALAPAPASSAPAPAPAPT